MNLFRRAMNNYCGGITIRIISSIVHNRHEITVYHSGWEKSKEMLFYGQYHSSYFTAHVNYRGKSAVDSMTGESRQQGISRLIQSG